ncbi:MAG TPA: thioredoxin-like domain-containing protein [Flavipsychrobacter sp.]|nr:thioredoxin-like domain-containing protein [Flavipsychrobacter sp.]
MKRITLFAILLLAGLAQTVFAKDGYKIQLKFTDVTDSVVYLAHYYGKPLPTIYKADSAKLDKNGVATFESKEKFVGGIYMMLLSDKKTYFEFLLDNGNDIGITATAKKLPDGLKFKNSPENDRFQDYVRFLKDFGARQQEIQGKMAEAKTSADSMAIRKQLGEGSKKLIAYRRDYVTKNPGTLLTSIFNSLEVPQVPEGDHFLADGKTKDSAFAYNYYKGHYWDNFNFQDDRLIYTPVYDAKLEEYFSKLVLPVIDSMEFEADKLLTKADGTKDMFKYTLWWLTHYVENSKVMGMDEVFVYLVENYYMKGKAYWLENDALQKYYEAAQKIAPNVIGNVAAEIKMQDINGKEQSLHGVKSKYTLLVFWSPECGHCLHEIPRIDSLYKAVLKNKGVKIYGVRVEGDEKKWRETIEKEKLDEWIHVYDPEYKSNFRSKFNVYSTPVIYLLDDKKIIRGKKLDHSTIPQVLEMIEKKDKVSQSKNSK